MPPWPLLFLLTPAQAIQFTPPPMPGDPRIQVAIYNPDQVTTLRVAPGFAAVVELGSDEHVENVVVGASDAWQVTANKAGDRVIVKPASGAAETNLVIMTDIRRYVLVLQPDRGGGTGAFALRYHYPTAPATQVVAAGVRTAEYKLKGDRALFPVTMGDDGRRTSITWDKEVALPAIFAVENGREALVNGRMVDGDYVIESVAPRFVFRRGKQRATASRRTLRAAR